MWQIIVIIVVILILKTIIFPKDKDVAKNNYQTFRKIPAKNYPINLNELRGSTFISHIGNITTDAYNPKKKRHDSVQIEVKYSISINDDFPHNNQYILIFERTNSPNISFYSKTNDFDLLNSNESIRLNNQSLIEQLLINCWFDGINPITVTDRRGNIEAYINKHGSILSIHFGYDTNNNGYQNLRYDLDKA